MMWITTKSFRVCIREVTRLNGQLRLVADKDWDQYIQLTKNMETEIKVDKITSKIHDYIYVEAEDLISINQQGEIPAYYFTMKIKIGKISSNNYREILIVYLNEELKGKILENYSTSDILLLCESPLLPFWNIEQKSIGDIFQFGRVKLFTEENNLYNYKYGYFIPEQQLYRFVNMSTIEDYKINKHDYDISSEEDSTITFI